MVQLEQRTLQLSESCAVEYVFKDYTDTSSAVSGPSANMHAREYHVPFEVQKHVDYITPGIRLRPDPGRVRRLKRRSDGEKLRKRMVKAMNTGLEVIEASGLPPLNSSVCDSYVTQQCIRTQYSIPKGDKAAPGNELGIFESLGTALHGSHTK